MARAFKRAYSLVLAAAAIAAVILAGALLTHSEWIMGLVGIAAGICGVLVWFITWD